MPHELHSTLGFYELTDVERPEAVPYEGSDPMQSYALSRDFADGCLLGGCLEDGARRGIGQPYY